MGVCTSVFFAHNTASDKLSVLVYLIIRFRIRRSFRSIERVRASRSVRKIFANCNTCRESGKK